MRGVMEDNGCVLITPTQTRAPITRDITQLAALAATVSKRVKRQAQLEQQPVIDAAMVQGTDGNRNQRCQSN
jgi:hypothetical protein